jgi:hypothetical protein
METGGKDSRRIVHAVVVLQYFKALPDDGQSAKIQYLLEAVLLSRQMAVIAGAETAPNNARVGQKKMGASASLSAIPGGNAGP